MKRKLFIVANPASGKEKLEDVLQELIDFVVSKKFQFEVFLTSKKHNAMKTVAKNFEESYTDLIVLGGDGTINEAVNGLTFDVPISIIPIGSGNDFTKMLDIGDSLEDHIQVILSNNIIKVDVGVCNGRKFVNGVGMGFDGQIVANMQNRQNILKGAARYYYFVLKILATYKSRLFNYAFDNQTIENKLILLCVANGSTFGGGFKLTPNADIQDGMLEVCEIKKISAFKRFLNIYRLMKGSHDVLKEVSFYKTTSIQIKGDDSINAHIDGELLGPPPYEISILPNSLSVRVAKKAK